MNENTENLDLTPPPELEDVDLDDFELPAKTCDIGRPEGCESCQ